MNMQGTMPIRFPLVGGHEGAGVVERVGSQVGHVEVGDHVLLTFSSCGECASCRRGIPAYCFNMWEMNFLGARRDGTTAFSLEDGKIVSSHFFGQSSFAQRTIVRGVSAIKVEKGLPLHLLCSMGCGMQTGAGTVLNALRLQVGQSLVVFGAGAVGMTGIMAARLTPATMIIAVDVLDSKLVKAQEMGATHTINPTEKDAVSEIRALTKGFGADRAIDTTGNVKVIKSMIECAAPGGIVATVGAPRKGATIEIEPAAWLARGVSYMGVHQGPSVPIQVLISFFNPKEY
jgi:aryl-alcohol dehydrogenase